jgi:hypothetical protein
MKGEGDMSAERVKLGELVPDDLGGRDAVHVAVVAMVATRVMQPGERLTNGMVDPFLSSPVQPGQRFWFCLFPGTVTGLRHHWRHPAYDGDEK